MIRVLLITLAVLSFNCLATTYTSVEIGYLRSPDERPCTLFQIKGISNASQTGSPWFAVPKSHHAYDDIIAMLLTAKVSQQKVDVTAASQLTCGHAEVLVIGIH